MATPRTRPSLPFDKQVKLLAGKLVSLGSRGETEIGSMHEEVLVRDLRAMADVTLTSCRRPRYAA